MDVFSMHRLHIRKEAFDCVALCVDRYSRQIVAVLGAKKVLLAKEVAGMIIPLLRNVFGVPRTICGDSAPQFSGGWFKAMCFLIRIRRARHIAYPSLFNS